MGVRSALLVDGRTATYSPLVVMMDGSRTLPLRAFAAPRPSEPAPLLPQPPWQRRDVGQQHPTSPGTQFRDGTAADADPRLLVPPVLLRPLLLHRVEQPQDEALLFGCFFDSKCQTEDV